VVREISREFAFVTVLSGKREWHRNSCLLLFFSDVLRSGVGETGVAQELVLSD